AEVVRRVYQRYTVEHLSIGAIARLLNEQGVPTRKRVSRWCRSMVWAILRNPAYKGTACFGKTEIRPRQRVTRPLRMRGGVADRNSANHERPRKEWIEIPVPAIVSGETFSLAQELWTCNKTHAPRRTIRPSICQGMVSCSKCGYALYRTSARTSVRKIYYYRCLGSDGWRYLNGPVCNNRPIREELLDQVVWNEIVKLIENPRLIEEEIDRRLEVAQKASPTKRRQETLQRDLARVRKGIERLMTAYQEDLLPLDELRGRMPDLRQRERAMQGELQSIATQAQDRASYLRLAETLSAFLSRLRSSANDLGAIERQRIVRLLVKEVIVAEETIIIRHSIPVTSPPPRDDDSPKSSKSGTSEDKSYLLRSVRSKPPARQHLHEPVPEALASKRLWRRVPGPRRLLCRRLRHPQPRSCGRGADLDEGGDDQARVDNQRDENLAEECPSGTFQLPWLLVWPAPPIQPECAYVPVHECEPLEEERATAQDESAAAAGAEEHRSLAWGARRS